MAMDGFGYDDTLETSRARTAAILVSAGAVCAGLAVLALAVLAALDAGLSEQLAWAVALVTEGWATTAAGLWALLRAVGGRASHAQLALATALAGVGWLFLGGTPA